MSIRRVLTVLLVAGVFCAWAGSASAGPISIDTADGVGADAYVRGGTHADTAFGGANDMVVKYNNSASYRRKAYVRFDLSSLGSQVLSDATLSLDVQLNNSGGGNPTPKPFVVNLHGLPDGHAGEGWGEGTITWNNAPANNTGSNGVTGAVLLGQINVPAEANPTVTFSDPSLAAFLNVDTDDQATVILSRTSLNAGGPNLVFEPKERGVLNPPTLTGQAVAPNLLSITTNDGNGADSYVRLGTATTNFGNAANVTVKNNGSGTTTRKGYLRFDLSSLSQLATNVSLNLDVATNNQGGSNPNPVEQVVNVYGLNDAEAGQNWVEGNGGTDNDPVGEINWNNAPANDTADNDIDTTKATLLGSFTVEALSPPQSIEFTSLDLVNFINADTDNLATIILQRQTSNGSWNLAFASGDHATLAAPTLEIAAVPEPASMALLLLCLPAIARRRRR